MSALGSGILQIFVVLVGAVVQAFGFWMAGQNAAKQKAAATAAQQALKDSTVANLAYAAATTSDPVAFAKLCDQFNF